MGEEVKEKERRARIRDARKRHFSAIVHITVPTDTTPEQVKSSQRFVGPTNFPGSFLSIHVTWLKCY